MWKALVKHVDDADIYDTCILLGTLGFFAVSMLGVLCFTAYKIAELFA